MKIKHQSLPGVVCIPAIPALGRWMQEYQEYGEEWEVLCKCEDPEFKSPSTHIQCHI